MSSAHLQDYIVILIFEKNPMLNLYHDMKSTLQFNKFVVGDLLFIEYTCPLEEDSVGIWAQHDYIIHVLSGRKTWKSYEEEWPLNSGETLYVKKGASIVDQFFDKDFCMLGFFISDDMIRGAYDETKSQLPIKYNPEALKFPATRLNHTPAIDGFINSMLVHFHSDDQPPDSLLQLKAKELIITILSSGVNPLLSSYLQIVGQSSEPSLPHIMESNFAYNLSISEFAEMCHRSVSSFKRDFQNHYNTSPGKWLLERRLKRAAELLIHEDDNISRIAFSCGFEDVSHFSRTFKQQYQMTPSEFKLTHSLI
jgi:AraC-like DNA-binding protein